MSQMVERVARAICKSHGLHPDADAFLHGAVRHYPIWQTYQTDAEAAIAAAGVAELEQSLAETLHFIETMPVNWTETRRLQEVAAKYAKALK